MLMKNKNHLTDFSFRGHILVPHPFNSRLAAYYLYGCVYCGSELSRIISVRYW